MKFRTEYSPLKPSLILDPSCPIALIGSCFAQNIARKMRECQWNIFDGAGTLYNPLSIAKVIDLFLTPDFPRHEFDKTIFESEGYFHSWLFDSHFSRKSKDEIFEAALSAAGNFNQTLARAQALIVTFGTSWCYFLDATDESVVANCHKMPQSLFLRRRITVDKIVDCWTSLCARLSARVPDLNIIFTVSPVRHLADGFEGNARSKATLLLAAEQICRLVANACYFPAFEIVTDDLRDYRFYAADLVHPSDQAIEYLWEKFRATFLSMEGERCLKDGEKMFKRLHHRQIKSDK